jgi:hypothetical protein
VVDAPRSRGKERTDCHDQENTDQVVPVSIKQRTRALVRGLLVVLKHHKAREPVSRQLADQVSNYLNMRKSEEQWLTACKDLLTYPKAFYLKNELPEAPEGEIMNRFQPTRLLKKWMMTRLRVFNASNTHLWYTWFQTKRATLPVSDDFVEKTYAKHLKTLTKPDDGDDETIKKILDLPVFREVVRKVSDAVERCFTEGCDFRETQPSTNAAFESKRSEGGQQGHLCRLVEDHVDEVHEQECFDALKDLGIVPKDSIHKRVKRSEELLEIRSPELVSMSWKPYVVSAPYRLARSTFSSEDPDQHRYGGTVLETYEPVGRENWSKLLNMDSGKETLSATIQAVLEPNKVRVISKGMSIEYYKSKPFQKAMHSSLRDLAPFRLIGRPFEQCDVLPLREKAFNNWRWLSIDYSAATDNLSYKYSGKIFEQIICNLPEPTRNLLSKVLGAHDLYYPVKGGIEFRGRMTRGQLMGSILSFPVLCLANFGVYCLVMDTIRPEFSYNEILNHVLVNGDDMLYAAPEGTFQLHRELSKKVGLDMSVGKAYEHHTYLNINSVACHSDLRRQESGVRRIDFLNVGLLFGQHKVQNRDVADDHHTTSGVAACANEVLNGCFRNPEGILKMYLKLHSEELKKEVVIARCFNKHGIMVKRSFQRDLFLPVSLGGMGIKKPSGFQSDTLRLPQLYASYLLDREINNGEIINTQRPILGFEPEEVLLVPPVPWFEKGMAMSVDVQVDLRDCQRRCSEWRVGIFNIFKHTGFITSVPNKNHAR